MKNFYYNKCRNKLDSIHYAVKITNDDIKSYSLKVALNEAVAMASVSALNENNHIVRYHNCWVENRKLHIVMELCNQNLKSYIMEKKSARSFDESMCKKVIHDICQALSHIHKEKIVHLDIKPDNILLSKNNRFKLTDLGLTRLTYRQKGEDIQEGDCRYMAPELLQEYFGTGDFDECKNDLTKADIFSLGATIYEFMIGQVLPKNGEK